MMPMFTSQIAVETVIVAVASAIQAATGMGMALFAAPLLALVDPGLVPGPTLFAVMVLSAVVAWRERLMLDFRTLAPAMLGLLCGTAIGTTVLAILVGWHLAPLFAILILAAVLLSVVGMTVRVGRVALLVGGTASGVLGTMAGVHGPPIALVLQHEPPERLRGMLCAFFTVGCAISLAALASIGVFGVAEFGVSLELLPGVAVGLALAPIIAGRIDRRRARIAVLAISALSALALLFH
jgi:uncharacterized membrane protein YfcA